MNESLSREAFWRLMHGVEWDGSEVPEPSGAAVVQSLTEFFAPELPKELLVGTRFPSLPTAPRRFWWAIDHRLLIAEQSGRLTPAERRREVAWLASQGVDYVMSTHRRAVTLLDYRHAGLEVTHRPPPPDVGWWVAVDAPPHSFKRALATLRRAWGRDRVIAIHGDHQSSYGLALGVSLLLEHGRCFVEDAVRLASEAGMPLDHAANVLVNRRHR